MIDCAEAADQLYRYLDQTLDEHSAKRLEEHLGLCRQCCGELGFAQVLRRLLADQSASDQLPEDVRARMERFVKELES